MPCPAELEVMLKQLFTLFFWLNDTHCAARPWVFTASKQNHFMINPDDGLMKRKIISGTFILSHKSEFLKSIYTDPSSPHKPLPACLLVRRLVWLGRQLLVDVDHRCASSKDSYGAAGVTRTTTTTTMVCTGAYRHIESDYFLSYNQLNKVAAAHTYFPLFHTHKLPCKLDGNPFFVHTGRAWVYQWRHWQWQQQQRT